MIQTDSNGEAIDTNGRPLIDKYHDAITAERRRYDSINSAIRLIGQYANDPIRTPSELIEAVDTIRSLAQLNRRK